MLYNFIIFSNRQTNLFTFSLDLTQQIMPKNSNLKSNNGMQCMFMQSLSSYVFHLHVYVHVMHHRIYVNMLFQLPFFFL